MCHAISLFIIKLRLSRGFSFITAADGGNEASAMAANVSIIRLTHSICVTVSGTSVPIKAPVSTIKQATTFTVI